MILAVIEGLLTQSTEEPDPLTRPTGKFFTRLIMAVMPPQPDRHIVYGFGDIKRRFRWYHYPVALATMLLIMAMIQVQVHLVPWTKYSAISGAHAIAEKTGLAGWKLTMMFFVTVLVLAIALKSRLGKHSQFTHGILSKSAVYEEQAFREGAENWSFTQRFVSCVVFGALHMINMIYSIAMILPLAFGGAVFMVEYLRVYRRTRSRRAAVLASSIVHRVYNRLALWVFVIWMILLSGVDVTSLATSFAIGLISLGFSEKLVSK